MASSNIGGRIHQHRHVARSDAERRLAARVRGLHDARAAGGENHAGALVLHQRVGALDGGVERRTG